ncbi:mandelate racemase/muconate lactonizing enzyme family protein [Paeniglutamicibacter psychrophenolicus]|uniref:L-alanine-DL-glutamate epimerase-like enolase superfamily enzyme n=1 Tax=Paeniglutamicibacter psychrophenolicus TaxID=257454 RepID=A0ABS4W9T4_9MICC|nr:mandelate racemase/muconate lactonizing enzyme family protein [Paeniglutamicibacter psychrophenolicus]MBP2372960.1 L-alanine-DL-glutamate epimerase-like enolase superfamily enzyme [Paeniglutamicibacter psychrophenolicus]
MSVTVPRPVQTVESVELLRVRMPFSAARSTEAANESIDEFNASSQTFTAMESLMAKVTTSEGLVGWGEAFGHKVNDVTWAALESLVAPFYLGKPADPEALHDQAQRAFHAFGRTGPVLYAISALDIALWDIKAQIAEKPLRKLLNPAARDSIGAYASLVHYGEDPAEVTRQISRAQQQGFGAFKLHESSYPAIAAARMQAGAGAPLMVDVNCRWNEADAAEAIDSFLPLNLRWLEEPLWPPDAVEAHARLALRGIPLAGGENASGTEALDAALTARALDVAQPSIGKIGGFSSMLGHLHPHPTALVVPHCFYYGPAQVATAQFIAAMDDDVPLEAPLLLWEEHLHPLHAARPVIELPDTPGLGFAPDMEVLERHLVDRLVLVAAQPAANARI